MPKKRGWGGIRRRAEKEGISEAILSVSRKSGGGGEWFGIFFFGGVWDSPVSVFFLQNRYQKTPVPQIFGRKCTLEEKDHFCSVQSYGNFLALEKRPLFSVPIRGGEMSADGKFNCAYVADWEEGGTSSWETVSWTGIRKKGEIRTLNFERARRITHSPLPTTHTTCGKQFEVVLGNKKAF